MNRIIATTIKYKALYPDWDTALYYDASKYQWACDADFIADKSNGNITVWIEKDKLLVQYPNPNTDLQYPGKWILANTLQHAISVKNLPSLYLELDKPINADITNIAELVAENDTNYIIKLTDDNIIGLNSFITASNLLSNEDLNTKLINSYGYTEDSTI